MAAKAVRYLSCHCRLKRFVTVIFPPAVCGNLQVNSFNCTRSCSSQDRKSLDETKAYSFRNVNDGPGLSHFIRNVGLSKAVSKKLQEKVSHPYLSVDDVDGMGRKVYFDVYGCQMNNSDAEIAWGILQSTGYQRTNNIKDADVILVITCSIREGAEKKIWNKLSEMKFLKRTRNQSDNKIPLKIGILGCMAERLKTKLLEKESAVDLVAGPDSYRDLPRLLAITQSGERTINVLLSHEETYADIIPVSLSENSVTAFVSIMRGCDNLCSYCIVPFTRGRERSRPVASILEEVRSLTGRGIKEITLLGQNVNSYCDTSMIQSPGISLTPDVQHQKLSEGFSTVYKPKKGVGFASLLEKVASIDPETRIRFTSPHPKDFPDEVLQVIRGHSNVCKQVHLPAQCGNSRVLEMMRRGYTRESYLNLVRHMREIIPNICLSSDFIVGFCSETEQEFLDTLSLLEEVRYNSGFLFMYSVREKTLAHRHLVDDVTVEDKRHRFDRLSKTFRSIAHEVNQAQVGQRQLVLVEGNSLRSHADLAGRNDGFTKVIFPATPLPLSETGAPSRIPAAGDYVEVQVVGASSQVLKGLPLRFSSIKAFSESLLTE